MWAPSRNSSGITFMVDALGYFIANSSQNVFRSRSDMFRAFSSPTSILCNLDSGRRVVPMIELDLLVLTCRLVSKDNQLRIHRPRRVRRQCFRYRRDVPMLRGGRILLGVSCDITMLQNVLGRSVVVQPKRDQLLSRLVKYLESTLESIKNLYCSC